MSELHLNCPSKCSFSFLGPLLEPLSILSGTFLTSLTRVIWNQAKFILGTMMAHVFNRPASHRHRSIQQAFPILPNHSPQVSSVMRSLHHLIACSCQGGRLTWHGDPKVVADGYKQTHQLATSSQAGFGLVHHRNSRPKAVATSLCFCYC